MDPERVSSVDRVPHGGHAGSDRIEFSANVNPETPPGVETVYREAMDEVDRYPPEPPAAFREAAAEYVDVATGQIVASRHLEDVNA